jgi:uncharacterized membrane protein YoaT (DUF817 family)
MSPKEKAIELVGKYHKYANELDTYWNITEDAKEYARIAVSEIISACEYNNVESYNTDWWNKVKVEIDELPTYFEDVSK